MGSTSPHKMGNRTSLIVGGVAGGLAFLLLMALVLLCLFRRKSEQSILRHRRMKTVERARETTPIPFLNTSELVADGNMPTLVSFDTPDVENRLRRPKELSSIAATPTPSDAGSLSRVSAVPQATATTGGSATPEEVLDFVHRVQGLNVPLTDVARVIERMAREDEREHSVTSMRSRTVPEVAPPSYFP
jgi:hypothetical protein